MAEPTDVRTCNCGVAMTLNPHPEAGEPSKVNTVGAVWECVPCLVRTRNAWATRAHKAEAIASVAGDLWNEIENLRDEWENTERSSFIEEYIARYERLAI